jgi:L-ascorbate metabolism protein UlaG (beta-lactamase superfamily)
MRLRWFGQSAFRLDDGEHAVVIDPFGELPEGARSRGIEWGYPAVTGVDADVVLVTHEHFDHNGTDGIGGAPQIVRLAGTHETPIGTVVGIASEHDPQAGTKRGPNAIFRFALDGVTFAHMGDFGQSGLRPEQAAALEGVDVLFVPVGGGPTADGPQAAAIAKQLGVRVAIPMHYGTPSATFLGPLEPFLEAMDARVERVDGHETDLEVGDETVVLVLAPPAS